MSPPLLIVDRHVDRYVDADRQDPVEAALIEDERAAVRRAIEALRPTDRWLLVQRYYHEHSVRTLALHHRVSEDVMRRRLRETLSRFKDAAARQWTLRDMWGDRRKPASYWRGLYARIDARRRPLPTRTA